MKINYQPVKDVMWGHDKQGDKKGKGIRFANHPGAKLLRKFLMEQYRGMVRDAELKRFKKMPDCLVGHRIDMVTGWPKGK